MTNPFDADRDYVEQRDDLARDQDRFESMTRSLWSQLDRVEGALNSTCFTNDQKSYVIKSVIVKAHGPRSSGELYSLQQLIDRVDALKAQAEAMGIDTSLAP